MFFHSHHHHPSVALVKVPRLERKSDVFFSYVFFACHIRGGTGHAKELMDDTGGIAELFAGFSKECRGFRVYFTELVYHRTGHLSITGNTWYILKPLLLYTSCTLDPFAQDCGRGCGGGEFRFKKIYGLHVLLYVYTVQYRTRDLVSVFHYLIIGAATFISGIKAARAGVHRRYEHKIRGI